MSPEFAPEMLLMTKKNVAGKITEYRIGSRSSFWCPVFVQTRTQAARVLRFYAASDLLASGLCTGRDVFTTSYCLLDAYSCVN